MSYLLDTNTCIKILNGKSAAVKENIEQTDDAEVIIPSVVRYELFYGAYKSDNPKKTLSGLRDFLSAFRSMELDETIALTAGKIRAELDKKGTPIGPYDILIGAFTRHYDLILVTHNVAEFSRIDGLRIQDWEKSEHTDDSATQDPRA